MLLILILMMMMMTKAGKVTNFFDENIRAVN